MPQQNHTNSLSTTCIRTKLGHLLFCLRMLKVQLHIQTDRIDQRLLIEAFDRCDMHCSIVQMVQLYCSVQMENKFCAPQAFTLKYDVCHWFQFSVNVNLAGDGHFVWIFVVEVVHLSSDLCNCSTIMPGHSRNVAGRPCTKRSRLQTKIIRLVIIHITI